MPPCKTVTKATWHPWFVHSWCALWFGIWCLAETGPPPLPQDIQSSSRLHPVCCSCTMHNKEFFLMNGWSMELTTHLHPILQSIKHSTLLQNKFYLYISNEIFCPPTGSGNQVVENAYFSPCCWSLLCKCNNLFLVAIWASTLSCHFYSVNINTTV